MVDDQLVLDDRNDFKAREKFRLCFSTYLKGRLHGLAVPPTAKGA
jgi:hypothetical protein